MRTGSALRYPMNTMHLDGLKGVKNYRQQAEKLIIKKFCVI